MAISFFPLAFWRISFVCDLMRPFLAASDFFSSSLYRHPLYPIHYWCPLIASERESVSFPCGRFLNVETILGHD